MKRWEKHEFRQLNDLPTLKLFGDAVTVIKDVYQGFG